MLEIIVEGRRWSSTWNLVMKVLGCHCQASSMSLDVHYSLEESDDP